MHKDDMSASLHVLIFLKHNTEKNGSAPKETESDVDASCY